MKLNNGLIRMSVTLYIWSLYTIFGACKADCNYYHKLKSGETYYVNNFEYPNNYTGENKCVWQVDSQEPIQLNCAVEIPPDCNKNHLSIKFHKSKEEKYCGSRTFISAGNDVTIRFRSSKSSPGGRFLCALETETKCNCGGPGVPRVAGGVETGVNEYPMMAGLVDAPTKELFCGATIISSKNIITTALCVENKNVSTIAVIVGEHDVFTGTDINASNLYPISECIVHPQYEPGKNDVAICNVIGDILFSEMVGPVCLPFQRKHENFNDVNVTLLGWGTLNIGGAKSSVLQKVDVKVIPLNQCKGSDSDVDNDKICTSGKDTCQMVSGGPALWKNTDSRRFVLVGVIADGCTSGTGSSDEIVTVVRVGYTVSWIASVIPDAKYCPVE